MTQRCMWPDCPTIISTYNPGRFCWAHTPDLGDKLLHIYPRPHTIAEKRMAPTTDISAEERAHYKRGGGAY